MTAQTGTPAQRAAAIRDLIRAEARLMAATSALLQHLRQRGASDADIAEFARALNAPLAERYAVAKAAPAERT